MKTVCMFLKAPRVGEAKSRLARGIGARRANAIYRALVEHQAREIPVEWRVIVYFAPANAGEEMKIWLAPHLRDGSRGYRRKERPPVILRFVRKSHV